MRNLRYQRGVQRPVFLLVFAQALLYIIIAPSVVALLEDAHFQRTYLEIQFEQLAFFLVPFVALYVFLRPRLTPTHIASVQVDSGRFLLLAAVFVAYEIVYWSTVARLGLFTRRLGTEIIAGIFGDLSFMELVIVRLHDLSVFLFPPLFLVIALRAPRSGIARVAISLLVLSLMSLLLHTLLNSRLQLVLGAAALAIVYLRLRPPLSRGNVIVGATGFAVMCALLMWSVYAIREQSALSRGLLHSADAPASERAADTNFILDEWVRRLDCVALIAEVRPSMDRADYDWGAAWRVPFFMMVGAFVDKDEYAAVKAEGISTAKSWMLEEHTAIGLRDYYSCALTDAFGNFGRIGYLLAAVYFAVVVALSERLMRARHPAALFLGVAVFLHVAIFEAEMFTHLFGWLKFAGAVILLLALHPIRSMTLLARRQPAGRRRAQLSACSMSPETAG